MTNLMTLAICGVVTVLLLVLLVMVAFAIAIRIPRTRDTDGGGLKEAQALFDELNEEEQEAVLAQMRATAKRRGVLEDEETQG